MKHGMSLVRPLNNLKIHESPKLITAKGALCVPFEHTFEITKNKDKFWLGNEDDGLVSLSENRELNEFVFRYYQSVLGLAVADRNAVIIVIMLTYLHLMVLLEQPFLQE